MLGLLRDHGARTLIKSKSMLTDECGMGEHLRQNGIEITETDLGERIQTARCRGAEPYRRTGGA